MRACRRTAGKCGHSCIHANLTVVDQTFPASLAASGEGPEIHETPGPRRWPPRPNWHWGVPVVCLVMGLLLAVTYVTSQGRELRTADSARLSDLVRQAQLGVERAESARDGVAASIAQAQQRAAGADSGVAALVSDAAAYAVAGTLTQVEGPGLTVTLTDAVRDDAGAYPAGAAANDLVVHQQDVQAVLNALWAGGATAIQMQDQRIDAMSAPRCIGNTLLLGGRTYSPPYTMRAIGPADQMKAALEAARGVQIYKQYAARYGLGYKVEPSADLTVVASTAAPRLQYASIPQP